ncbi:sulfotransferase family protein [Paenibacillus spongiae]|uniref:Sulfotransferase n=1 Tax=Paenibacillus spongiae TaxID=2909671 RepID=A0ABY5SFV4_9BACL|nr:sulfotransferase [Paenibacillus spongiae]UVI31617.1 sulfotransferase [Paenibacillus spongiae]
MIDSKGNNLIFLLSTPRSGSSLATVMLQNHRKIFAAQEMWFLMSLYDLHLAPQRPYGGKEIVKQFFNGVLPYDTYIRACKSFALQTYNGLLQSSGEAEMVVDKSPRYYYVLEFLDALFPQSKRIWLIRNPLAVISSYKKVNRHTGDRFQLKEDLLSPKFNIKMADITIGLLRYCNYFAKENPHSYRLYYEKMVTSPQEELLKLCGFLGITYEEGLEKYGNFMDTSKSDLYFSMGVGDPFVGRHTEPHPDSLHIWKEVLDKEEIEMYCRVLGAELFHELGYSEELAEAERITGVRFESKPDEELLQLRTRQLAEAAGCRWIENYRMSADFDQADDNLDLAELPTGDDAVHPQVLQLQITLRSLEKRLEKSHNEQIRLRTKLDHITRKIDRAKAKIPFGNHLYQWASAYLNK